MKIVVTGATGHLGRHVVHHLAQLGHEIIAASRSGQTPAPPFEASAARVTPLAADLAHDAAIEPLAQALAGGAALVHLAAWHPPATASTSTDDRHTLLAVNVLGTMRAYEAARRARASTVVYASTFEVYGATDDQPLTERSRVAPLTDYGATKLAGEDHLCSLTAEDGIRGVSLRLPAIYGPGETTARALPNFLRSVARGERPTVLGDGADLRDQLHVRDAALAIERALSYGGSGIYNVADGHPHSIAELARVALAAAGLGGEPTLQPRQKPRRDYHMNIDLARHELGFEPRVKLADGMAEQLRWLRAEARA